MQVKSASRFGRFTPGKTMKTCYCLIRHHAMKTYGGSGGTNLRILDFGARRRWVLSSTPRPLYSLNERKNILDLRGLFFPRMQLTCAHKFSVLTEIAALYRCGSGPIQLSLPSYKPLMKSSLRFMPVDNQTGSAAIVACPLTSHCAGCGNWQGTSKYV
jgi:hypothetical protein